VCRDFPGRTFTAAQAKDLCGVAQGVYIGTYISKGMLLGRKHRFEYADTAVATADAATDGADPVGSDDEEGTDDDDEPPNAWANSRLWTELRAATGKRQQRIRNVLVERFLHCVTFRAHRMHGRLPDEVELDDLISDGVFGLMDAIKKFQPERGVKFETYCGRRIDGAMLDGLRDMDWAPRLVRAAQSKLSTSIDRLRHELGREPVQAEVIGDIGLSGVAADRLLRDGRMIERGRLGTIVAGNDHRDVSLGDMLTAPGAQPDEAMEDTDFWQWATTGMPRREKVAVLMYHRDDVTMKEIGRALGVSESRVSQMLSNLNQVLKARLSEREREAAL
jgi:RNA polymerase sigma factor for flagellar operon FliA